MNKSNRIYAVYVAAVLAIGSFYLYFRHDTNENRIERGTVSPVILAETSSVGTTAVKTAKAVKTTTVRQTAKAKTTTAKLTTAKATKTTTEPVVTEPEILWLDINEASAEELAKLPDIGEKTAAEIVVYREMHGRFGNIEELLNVSGIGEGRLESIREYIYVTAPVYDEPENTEQAADEQPAEAETEHIPTLDEVAPIDLNTANKEVLMLLPNVDEEIAQRIIDFREQAGGFSHPYELLYIEGLTQEKAAEIIEFVTVNNSLVIGEGEE